MTVAFFKSRCLICWKQFEIPKLPDSSYGDNLYYDKKDKTFGYFSWFDNKNIEAYINSFLSFNDELQTLNDNTKGNTARQLVGLIADGDNECMLGLFRCPRCGFKLTYTSDTRMTFRDINELSFSKFLSLDAGQRNIYLMDRFKNGL